VYRNNFVHGCIVIKRIGKRRYVYYCYYDYEKKKQVQAYCGPADKRESFQKALELQLNYITKLTIFLQMKANEIKERISQMKEKPLP